MATYIKPNAIKDASIEGIKIKDGTISSSKISTMIQSITWSDLVDLRNNSRLIPGVKYRITDYITTTSQEDTRSAGHQFDIIVDALDENTLNENASAIQHTDDTYFADSKLESWELKYCLDNDTTRFAWALQSNKYMTIMDPWGGDPFDVKYVDTKNISGITYDLWRYDLMTADTYYGTKSLRVGEEVAGITNHDSGWEVTERVATIQAITEHGGKGVIYWMKDEYDNECPYDFKNIQFKRYAVTDITSAKLTSDALNSLNGILKKNRNGGLYFATKDDFGNFVPSYTGSVSYKINENDYNWYYTFQGMYSVDGSIINKLYDLTVETFKLTDECISSLQNDGTGADTEDCCRENKIEQLNQEFFGDNIFYKGRQILNNIVFIGGLSYCYYETGGDYWNYKTSHIFRNRFGENCKCNTFGNYCIYNSFGNDCSSNTFGNNCHNFTFGNGCYNNTFGNNCHNFTFGNNCYSNTFGNGCEIIFGNNCHGNTFGNSCQQNTFGNSCQQSTFGNGCYNNTFGNSCISNSFGNNCQSNTFGNNCQYNSIGNYCQYNTFGNYCQSNTFGNNCSSNSIGNDCSSNSIGNDCQYNTFGNDCRNNTFGNDIQESQFGDGVQYFSITTRQMTTKPTSSYLKNYIRWLIVENGVRYVNAYVTGSTSSSSYCQNVRICLGIQGASSNNRKAFNITSCINSKVNNVYQPVTSQTTSV